MRVKFSPCPPTLLGGYVLSLKMFYHLDKYYDVLIDKITDYESMDPTVLEKLSHLDNSCIKYDDLNEVFSELDEHDEEIFQKLALSLVEAIEIAEVVLDLLQSEKVEQDYAQFKNEQENKAASWSQEKQEAWNKFQSSRLK